MTSSANFSSSGFFNRVWPLNQTNWASYFAPTIPDGVIEGIGNEMEVYANSTGMHVYVPTGECRVRSHRGSLTAQVTLDIEAANASNPRYDLIVARVTYGNPSTMELAVKKGTAASTPVIPVVTQTAGSVWEIPLAAVYVAANVVTIAADAIVDKRYLYKTSQEFISVINGTSVTCKNMNIHRASSELASLTITLPVSPHATFISEVDFSSSSSFTGVTFQLSDGAPWTSSMKLAGDALNLVSKRYNLVVWWDGGAYWVASKAV